MINCLRSIPVDGFKDLEGTVSASLLPLDDEFFKLANDQMEMYRLLDLSLALMR
jgi:translation elongation factor EF-4